jgi:hypothetical protein
MIVPIWENGSSEAEYRGYLKQEYLRLKQKQEVKREAPELDEVKLRLFISLLDTPVVKAQPLDDVRPHQSDNVT